MGFEGAAPVVQGDGVTEKLITKMPTDYIRDGDAADVPLIMGANRDEGSLVFGSKNHYV